MSSASPVAVVTGAGGGIGSAVVRALTARDWSVVGVDLAEPPESMAAGLPPRLDWVVGDVRDDATLQQAMELAGRLGPLRGLVTATFAERRAPLQDLDRSSVAAVFDVHATTAWAWSAAVAGNAPADGASIVHVSSVHAERAAKDMAAYAMAKAALGALVRATAVEWGPRGVRCNAVLPGFVPVERNARRWSAPQAARDMLSHHPLGRFVTAEDVAQVVAFLLGPESRAVTGASLPVDGGMLALLPEWA
jgi:NAD(P)-dependent dehydrogenase (short-subunit alcohol dehydrogenase family)